MCPAAGMGSIHGDTSIIDHHPKWCGSSPFSLCTEIRDPDSAPSTRYSQWMAEDLSIAQRMVQDTWDLPGMDSIRVEMACS